jgi:hypothetical protein
MSDFHDFFENLDDQLHLKEGHARHELLGDITSIAQRNKQLAAQKEQLEALKEQAKIAKQRLEIEKKRLAAEEAEREYRRQQEEQIKQLRNLLADSVSDLDLLATKFPA